MAAEPGKVFVYSSGVTQLLSHIFKKATGKNVDAYAAEYLFQPLGIRYHWKHSPTGLPDAEVGIVARGRDIGNALSNRQSRRRKLPSVAEYERLGKRSCPGRRDY